MNSALISATTYTTTVAANGPSIGECVEVQGVGGRQVFMWCKNVGADTTVIGDVVAAATSGAVGEVTAAAATALVNAVSTVGLAVGVAQAVTAQNGYLWVQTKGPGAVLIAVTDGGIAAGDPLVLDAAGSPIGGIDTMADGEEESAFGWALAADSGTTQVALTYILSNTVYG